MSGIEDNHVDPRPHQGLETFFSIGTDTDRGTDPQPAEIVFAGQRVLAYLLDVLDRN